MRREKDGDPPIKARQRRYVEAVVVLMAQEHGVDRGKGVGAQHARRVHALFERVDISVILAEQRIHEEARARRPDHPDRAGKRVFVEMLRIDDVFLQPSMIAARSNAIGRATRRPRGTFTMPPIAEESLATGVATERLVSLVRELHAFLLSAKQRLDEEIRSYPTPIPRCDAQFNFLYEQRSRLQDHINGIGDATAVGLAGPSCRRILDGFVRAPELTDLASERALRLAATRIVAEFDAEAHPILFAKPTP